MQPALEDAERYATAGLFTLALHSCAALADGGAADWGEPEEDAPPLAPDAGAGDCPDAFWGRDLAAAGGLLEAVYLQLGLPSFKWAGLKALPVVAPGSDSAAFRAAVRSLIAVLDAELAAALPALSAPPRRKRGAAAGPAAVGPQHTGYLPSVDDMLQGGQAPESPLTPGERRVAVHDEMWEGLLSSSEDEKEGGGDDGGGGGEDEFRRDVAWERRLEEEQRRRQRAAAAAAAAAAGGGGAGAAADAPPPAVEAAAEVLQALSSPRVLERRRSGEHAAALAAALERLAVEVAPPQEDPGSAAAAAAAATEEEEEAASATAVDKGEGVAQLARPAEASPPAKPPKPKPPLPRPEVSPVALAALWELLQCCVGAGAAAADAAKAGSAAAAADRAAATNLLRALRRQGPPPCIRWYDARARAALGLVCHWLQLPHRKLSTLEVLLGSDRAPVTVGAARAGGAGGASADRFRYLKVGLAAAGGGALFAVTGGLAAPAIAAGVGSLLGIVPGAGAAAGVVAGFMSTTGGLAAVTTTMATAGAATTGSKMAYRTADVKEFGFVALPERAEPAALRRPPSRRPSASSSSAGSMQRSASEGEAMGARTNGGGGGGADPGHLTVGGAASGVSRSPSAVSVRSVDVDRPAAAPPPEDPAAASPSAWARWFGRKGTEGEEAPLLPGPLRRAPAAEGVRLSAVVCVAGWTAAPEDFVAPWRCVRAPAADRFALVWCSAELAALHSALGGLLAKGAAGQAARFGVQHLLAAGAGLVSALGPTVLLGAAAGLLIENAWTVALDRADKGGKLLAACLMAGGAGGRPVTLIAHSVGARLVFSALLELCRCGARGLVHDVLLLGACVAPAPERWRMARRAVAGRLVNGHSANDWLLGVMYAASRPPAGLAPVEAEGVENVRLDGLVAGHQDHLKALGEILGLVGLPA